MKTKSKAILIFPIILLFMAAYALYQSHENSVALAAKRTIDLLPTNSAESKAWIEWSAKQPGASDPQTFLDQ